MNEGVYRVLRTLSEDGPLARSALIRRAGEPHSVLAELERDKARFFDETGKRLALSERGHRAIALEQRARDASALSHDELCQTLAARARERPPARRELDQVFAEVASVAHRARMLVVRGEAQRGVLFLGDDDLTSVALVLLLRAMVVERPVRAIDLDPALVSFLRSEGVEAVEHDVREPLPKSRPVGCVFTDPPYEPAGFRLFVSRGIEPLKADGRLYVCFGSSRRASERGLQKQRILAELGVLVEEVMPDFTRYDGGESIGARSDLWVTRRTPMTRSLVSGILPPDVPLYTRRPPKE